MTWNIAEYALLESATPLQIVARGEGGNERFLRVLRNRIQRQWEFEKDAD
jgi:hypothetical protein